MIKKLLRDCALRFKLAEQVAIAQWRNQERSRGDCCPVNKDDFREMIKSQLTGLEKAA
jgi:hypothetical protein